MKEMIPFDYNSPILLAWAFVCELIRNSKLQHSHLIPNEDVVNPHSQKTNFLEFMTEMLYVSFFCFFQFALFRDLCSMILNCII
jgi:hypothetical protein